MPDPESIFLSTSQAADLLHVHESSVKRWTNEGKLRPEKTAGGHRRIALPDLLDFARAERNDSLLLQIAPFEDETARAALACREQNRFDALATLIMRLCDFATPRHLTLLIRYLDVVCGVPLARTLDLGVAEAMRRVGREWESGVRTIAMEHRFTQKVLDALYGLRSPDGDDPGRDAPLALVGCAEACNHEIGAMFVRLVLESSGWKVCYLGANVPFAEYAGIQAETRARMVCVSFVPPTATADARRCLITLAGLYREENPYALALGGGTLDNQTLQSGRWPFQALRVQAETETFQAWARSRAKPKKPSAKENP